VLVSVINAWSSRLCLLEKHIASDAGIGGSRDALALLAVNLLVLMTARRVRQSFQAGCVLSDAGGIRVLRFIEPLGLLRDNAARLRSYWGAEQC
jgi:hypothetical protein